MAFPPKHISMTLAALSGWLDLFTTTRGSLLYRGASQWVALAPGTAGSVLKSQGAGADPIFGTVASGVSAWVTATSYIVDQGVTYAGIQWKCVSAHTSTSFAADLANWSVDTKGFQVASITAHGFVMAQPVSKSGSSWVSANAAADTTCADGVVWAVIDADHILICTLRGAIITATTAEWDAIAGTTGGLVQGTSYRLSETTAGHIYSGEIGGISQFIYTALSATQAVVLLGEPMNFYGTLAKDTLRLTMSAHQTTDLTTGDHVKFDIANGNLYLNTGTYSKTGTGGVGRITLKAGRKYNLRAIIWAGWSAQTSSPQFQFFDCTNNTAIGTIGYGVVNYSTSNATTEEISLEATITPTTDVVVDLRVTTAGTLSGVYANVSTAWIESVEAYIINANATATFFNSAPVGYEYWIDSSVTGAAIPPAGQGWVRLKSGLTGSGLYNAGLLTGESVTGTAPLVLASAVVNDPSSPMYGQTVRLMEDEERGTRAGQPGRLQDHQFQGHRMGPLSPGTGFLVGAAGTSAFVAGSYYATTSTTGGPVTDGTNGNPLYGNETRHKNKGYAVYLKIR